MILHGTDTLAYTSSALSFMLENLGKPVRVTMMMMMMMMIIVMMIVMMIVMIYSYYDAGYRHGLPDTGLRDQE